MPYSPEMKLWRAKNGGFDVGAGMVCAGVLLMLFMGHQLDVFKDIQFKEDGPPWKIMVVSVMLMIPVRLGKRWYVGKKPDGT